MTGEEMKKSALRGWNTWFSPAMTAHVLLPYGFAVNLAFKDMAMSGPVRDLKVGDCDLRPGERSWDGSYTSLRFSCPSADLTVEGAADGEELLLIVTPEPHGRRPPVVIAEAALLWGKEGTVRKSGGEMSACFPDGREIRLYLGGERSGYAYGNSTAPSVSLVCDKPVTVSTFPVAPEEARRRMDAAKEEVARDEARFGGNAETYRAVKSGLAWNTVYDPENDRLCTPVSRAWNASWGGYVLFDWDTYFAALMCGESGRELAYLNALAITDEMTEAGFVPNFGTNEGVKSRDRSQPPVGSMVAELLWKRFGDAWFVREIWPKLFRWNTWFTEHRTFADGTMGWGSDPYEPTVGRSLEIHDVHNQQAAKYESGLDNSPMYDGAVFDPETNLMLLSDVGLTGLFIKDCRALIAMADCAGHPEAVPVLAERLRRAEEALETLWNPDDGIYENRDLTTGKLSPRVSPTNLYALFSSRVTPERKRSMAENWLFHPDKLGGEWFLPSICRDDPAFPDQDYWRGRVWGPMNLLVYEALRDAGLDGEAGRLAENSKALLLREWREHRHVHENYNAITGEGCDARNSNNFYHWGGLLGWIALDAARR